MSWLVRALRSSIGKKQIVAVTGLLLCGFLTAHLAGNLLIYAGWEPVDAYARKLEENRWFLIPAEIGLAALFLGHIGLAIRVNLENLRARGSRYRIRGDRGAKSTASSTMVITGLIVLVFLVLHLIDFRFGTRIDGSLGKLVLHKFQASLGYTIWYIAASCILALHVSHGVQSAVRSLGFQHPRCEKLVRYFGWAFAILVAAGYGSIPLYARYFAEKISVA